MRLRIRFSKMGKVRFTGHRDVARIWERALRKANVPIALTQGFSPRPRVSFGLALPTGAESLAEYLDVEVASGVTLEADAVKASLARALPPGFGVVAVAECVPGGASLQAAVVATQWWVGLAVAPDRVAHEVERVMSADTLPVVRERKGERREDDVRSQVELVEVAGPPVAVDAVAGASGISVMLAAEGRSVRPLELVGALFEEMDPLDVATRVLRTHQWIETDDGARHEPLPAAAAPVGA